MSEPPAQRRPDVSGLRALFVNCTLKPSPARSHTAGLMAVSAAIMHDNGVHVDEVHAVDHDLAPGVQPDMTEHGAARDGWPALIVAGARLHPGRSTDQAARQRPDQDRGQGQAQGTHPRS